jgi:hypothetical protein
MDVLGKKQNGNKLQKDGMTRIRLTDSFQHDNEYSGSTEGSNGPTLGSKEEIWSCNGKNLNQQSDINVALPEYRLTHKLFLLLLSCERTHNVSLKTLALKSSNPSNCKFRINHLKSIYFKFYCLLAQPILYAQHQTECTRFCRFP